MLFRSVVAIQVVETVEIVLLGWRGLGRRWDVTLGRRGSFGSCGGGSGVVVRVVAGGETSCFRCSLLGLVAVFLECTLGSTEESALASRERRERSHLHGALVAELLDRLEGVAEVRLGVHLVRPELVHCHQPLQILRLQSQ